jgi:hypothetical protein
MKAVEQGTLASATLRCASCGGVIGVYEPLVHVVDGIAHKTSRAADPQLSRTQAATCYHVACHDPNRAGVVTVA